MHNNKQANSPILVGVYGSLREGLSNHKILGNSKLVGTFQTLPEFSMYDLGSYPAIINKGNTSISVEVYEVAEHTLEKLDCLEGYYSFNSATNHYNRRKIDSPYGEIYVYLYNDVLENLNLQKIVESGDWKDYHETKHLTY